MIGVVLAGGAGRRMRSGGGAGTPESRAGEGKATVLLAGRPLISYPLAALAGECERVAVACKRDTELPSLGAAERWEEPDEPRHPLTGIRYALERAAEAVLVCAADMPLVTGEACRSLISAASRARAPVTAAVAGDVLQPVFAVYAVEALAALRVAPVDEPLTRTVESLGPHRVALPERLLTSVNTRAQLAEAEAALRGAG